MRIATYTRISTDEAHQPYSLEAQSERLASYAKSQDDWRIVRRFSDQASGASLERLVWEPELSYLSEEPISSVLVPATRPADLTGRPRFVLYGPFINLPPGPWSASTPPPPSCTPASVCA